MRKIAAIVSFCTNEYRFLATCLEELQRFCHSVTVVVSDHFFDGTPENRELLQRAYFNHPDVRFLEFAYGRPFGLSGVVGVRHWHAASRYIGAHFADEEYLLFVDVDEIVDGERFKEFVPTEDVLHFSSYVYCEEEGRRSETHQNSVLMVKRAVLEPELLLNDHERPGYFFGYEGNKRRSVHGSDGKPMVHHYNWVRSKSELLKKVGAWGHAGDRNWREVIQKSGYQNLTDLQYVQVAPAHRFLDLDVEALSEISFYRHFKREEFDNVQFITPKDIIYKSIENLLAK